MLECGRGDAAEPLPVFSNPVTGERAVILTDPREHPDEVLVSHLFVRPAAGSPPHTGIRRSASGS